MGERFGSTWKTARSPGSTLEFESPAALFRVLSLKRWELMDCGLVERTEDGKIQVPYDVIHADFNLSAVA
jgi:hypothetical protein